MNKIIAFVSVVGIVLSTFLAHAVAQNPELHSDSPKIAVVNMQQVLMQSSRFANSNTALQTQFKARQEMLSMQQNKLQEETENYNKTAAKMTQKERDATEKKLSDNKAVFLKQAEAFQKEFNKEQEKAMQSMLNRLSSIISNLAKKNGYTLVLDSQAVIYSNDASDVTKQVATEFNKDGK